MIEEKQLLAPFTSWLVGGPADFFCQPSNLEELKAALQFAKEQKISVTILGGGSNVLIGDEGIRGLVICMRKLKGIELIEDSATFRLTAWAGTPKVQLLKSFLNKKLAPALFLAGLPGDVGGGVVMNAGVGENLSPREFCEIVEWVEVLRDQTVTKIPANQIQWSYRSSKGWQPGVVTRVGFSWPNQVEPDIVERVKEANRIRLTKQPLDLPSCGSVFKNPQGQKAGALIEACGLKGFKIGGAQVSTKHANFIVNLGGATASDIRAVIQHVQKTVQSQKNIDLKTEVISLGYLK